MSSSRAGMGGGGGTSAGIPANARKVVQNLKEIVDNSDDEIYAMLQECNMDLNETAQRLLNQDPFLEVKRRRDKKKEIGGNKDSTDMRGRLGSGGNTFRGGRGGAGRGSFSSRHSSFEHPGGRGRPLGTRENGVHRSPRGPSTVSTPASSIPISSSPSHVPHMAVSSGASSAATTTGSSAGLANGSALYFRSSPVSQGTWGSGHATMADILKSNGPSPAPPISAQALAVVQPALSQPYVPAAPIVSPTMSSGFYSSATDPVLHPSLDPRASSGQGAKRDLGTVGNQRPIGDRPSASLSVDVGSVSASPSQGSQVAQTMVPLAASSSLETDLEVQALRPSTRAISASPQLLQELPLDDPVVAGPGSSTESLSHQAGGTVPSGMAGSTGSRAVVSGSQFNGRSVYPSQQHPVGLQKATGSGLEWKPKAAVQHSLGVVTELPTPSTMVGETSMNLQALSIQDDQPVIIPNHLQVPEADRTRLSFGSFGAGFGTSFGTSYGAEDVSNGSVTIAEVTPAIETPVEQPDPSSVQAPVPVAQSYGHQAVGMPVENTATSSEVVAVSLPATVAPQLELPKPEPLVQQPSHYPYLPAVSTYPVFGLMPQLPGGQYAYDPADSQPQDVSRVPSIMQPYSDPTTSYYTPGFRPGTDGDARYSSFITSNAASKYNGNMGLIAGPSLPSSQESGTSMLQPSVPPTSQPGSNAQAAPSMPQHALSMHAYTAQVPLAHYGNVLGYQYLPSSYTYMHSHYQHNYSPGNSGYGQPPTGSTYPLSAATSYPLGGAAPVKYPLPQYKAGSGTGNAPHSAATGGYGGFTAAPSGYATNAAVSTGNATGYDDVVGAQYKDNNTLYIPNQQMEGSTVWIQTQMLRDMGPTTGMQGSSYYNLPGQGQHSAYAHTQQPTHGHAHPGAAYPNVYHPSQSGPAPTAQQLLQQPQVGGVGSAQAGVYQQPQRLQQTWTNNY